MEVSLDLRRLWISCGLVVRFFTGDGGGGARPVREWLARGGVSVSDSARMNFRRWGVAEWMWFGSDGSGGCCFGSRWSSNASEAEMIRFLGGAFSSGCSFAGMELLQVAWGRVSANGSR